MKIQLILGVVLLVGGLVNCGPNVGPHDWPTEQPAEKLNSVKTTSTTTEANISTKADENANAAVNLDKLHKNEKRGLLGWTEQELWQPPLSQSMGEYSNRSWYFLANSHSCRRPQKCHIYVLRITCAPLAHRLRPGVHLLRT